MTTWLRLRLFDLNLVGYAVKLKAVAIAFGVKFSRLKRVL
jgi:hypothetical protein